jgi:bifunctional NMN adenylyltransferase/nudix hydrolase
VQAALERSARCVVALEWAGAAPSPAHPLSWEERAAVLRQSVPDGSRLAFLPVRQHYDPRRAQRLVEQALRLAPGWKVESAAAADRDAVGRLHALYAAEDLQAAVAGMAADLTPPAVAALRDWIGTPAFERLRGERRKMAEEQAVWARVPWPVTLVTVDAVVRASGQVLLVRRGRSPGQGLWALPGGFLEAGDTLLQSALRELVEETGMPASRVEGALRAVKVFDAPSRSQRGRIVNHAHFFDLGDTAPPPVQGGDDAAIAQWVPIEELAAMEAQFHDDHFHILDEFLGLTGDP